MKGGLETLGGKEKSLPPDIEKALKNIDWEHVEDESKEPGLIQYLEEITGREIPEELWSLITEKAGGKETKKPGLGSLTITISMPGHGDNQTEAYDG